MAGPDLPSTSIQSIDLTLNRLINFRKNLSAKLVMHSVNGSGANGMGSPDSGIQGIDTNMVKTILEENPGVKEQRDSAKFFQIAVIKILNKIIDEQIQKFHANKQLEKEIVLLEGRLKDSQKTEEDRQKVQADLNRLNSLESLERAKMLMMLNTLQTLNDRYLYLEVEKEKAFKQFSQVMLKTLDGVKKDDGTLLTAKEKTDLADELSKIAVDLAGQYMDKHENKLEGRRFNEILNTVDGDVRNFKKDGAMGYFLPTYKQNNGNDVFKEMTKSSEFNTSYVEAAKEALARRNIKDPVVAQTILQKQFETFNSDPNFKKNVGMSREQKIVAEHVNEIIKTAKSDKSLYEAIGNPQNKREQMFARTATAKKM